MGEIWTAAIQQVTVDEFVDGRGKNVREVKHTRLKLADKNRSLELLGKHLKLFTERVEVSALEGLPERLDEAMKRKNAHISGTA